jgi:hypothetical protein
MLRSEKYEASRNLVLAYRTWADEVKATINRPDSIVFMDDLSNIERDGKRVDWRNEFAKAASSKNLFSEAELLKVNQSIAFAEYLTVAPTKATVLACGGEFGLISESEITRLKDEILILEGQIGEDIDLSIEPIEFAEALVTSGMRYLQEKMPWLHGITTKISFINPDSPFGAQVITDQDGNIVCELRLPEKINPKFVDTLIHEFLGHVLHFTQLKNNEEIQNDCPHLLCLTLHTHEPFFIEGIAQVLSLKMLKSNWDLKGKTRVLLENAKFRKTLAIVSFVLSKILDGSVPKSEAGKLHCSYSGEESELEKFEKVYDQTLRDLFVTKIRLNYHQSIMALEPLLKLNDDKFYYSMNRLLNDYYTPASLRKFVGECLA